MDIFYGNMAHAHTLVSKPPSEPGDKAIKIYQVEERFINKIMELIDD